MSTLDLGLWERVGGIGQSMTGCIDKVDVDDDDDSAAEPMAAEVMPSCSPVWWSAGTSNLVEAHRLWKVQRLDEAVATIAINFSSLTAVQRGTLLRALDITPTQPASTDTRSERDKAVGRVRSQWPTVWK